MEFNEYFRYFRYFGYLFKWIHSIPNLIYSLMITNRYILFKCMFNLVFLYNGIVDSTVSCLELEIRSER